MASMIFTNAGSQLLMKESARLAAEAAAKETAKEIAEQLAVKVT